MKELELKYGCNPSQKPSKVYMKSGELPFTVLSGRPGYINLMDALNSWQLVRELREATGLAAAASFKHVSPSGAAVGLPLTEVQRRMYWLDGDDVLSPLAAAYARARGTDRMSSYGDWIALSEVCDVATAKLICREVSDGVIAPGYENEALAMLREKRKGNYNILQMDESYVPAPVEEKDVFGVTFSQGRNETKACRELFANVVTKAKEIPEFALRDLTVATIATKYTQSNSVCYAADGQTIGVGAGQQSRIHCTRLAGDKADFWRLRASERVLELPFREDVPRVNRDNAIDLYLGRTPEEILAEGRWQECFTKKPELYTNGEKKEYLSQFCDASLSSDAFFPFDDNIERAYRSGVRYIAQPGGSIRDDVVIACCDRLNIAMAMTGARLFHH